MRFICVNEDDFDFAVLQNLLENGICSLVDITLPAQGDSSFPAVPRQSIVAPEHVGYIHCPSSLARRAREYVERDYMESDCTLSHIAKSMHVSPGYLSTVFKEYVGESFVSYITDFRIKRAKQLLANTELMVYEISEMVGYENHTYFSTLFKKLTGLSPKAWREENARSKRQNVRDQNNADNAQQNPRRTLCRQLLPVEHRADYHKSYRQKHV